MPKNKTKFNKNWLTKFRWISEVDDDIYKAYCKLCKRAFKIDVGGVGAVNVHQNTAKHKALSFKEARNESFNQYSTDVPSSDDRVEEDLDYPAESNEQEENDFEAYWFDPEAATDATTDAADAIATGSSSSSYSDQEKKHIPHLNHKASISKNSHGHPHFVPRNERTLSVQRMKMFEAELRVWQRKGEAIVKLMETVGQDKEMWEIINKQSRLHERERDRIREEYDIL